MSTCICVWMCVKIEIKEKETMKLKGCVYEGWRDEKKGGNYVIIF